MMASGWKGFNGTQGHFAGKISNQPFGTRMLKMIWSPYTINGKHAVTSIQQFEYCLSPYVSGTTGDYHSHTFLTAYLAWLT
jgi:hypothetical protein